MSECCFEKTMSSRLPVTELPNELTDNIETEDAAGFARTLRAVDGQIFSGWRGFSGLLDERCLESTTTLVHAMAALLKRHMSATAGGIGSVDRSKVAIVFTGCGTSGRVAFLIARRFNALLQAAGACCALAWRIPLARALHCPRSAETRA